MAQHRQISWPKSKHQESSKCSGAAADGPGGPVASTVCGGMHGRASLGGTAVLVWLLCCFVFFLTWLLIFCMFLLVFTFIMSMYLDLMGTEFTPIHLHFHSQIRVVFREKKREQRRTVRILDRVLRSKDESTDLDEQILSLLLSFLFSSFIFCNFDLNTISFDLGFYAYLV